MSTPILVYVKHSLVVKPFHAVLRVFDTSVGHGLESASKKTEEPFAKVAPLVAVLVSDTALGAQFEVKAWKELEALFLGGWPSKELRTSEAEISSTHVF